MGTRAELDSSMKNIDPAQKSIRAIQGKVVRRRLRRPKVSIVQIAGKAKTVLTSPKPKDASRH